ATANLPTLVVFLVLLPCVVNATFYLELALGRSLAWVDPRLTARWEAVVYACSAGLALGWFALMHANVDPAALPVTGAGPPAAAGLTGEVLRLRRPVVARALAREQVVAPGREQPGSEVLVPLYHAAQLVGVWSVRHSDPAMYRDSDGDMLALLAPQLALMLAI